LPVARYQILERPRDAGPFAFGLQNAPVDRSTMALALGKPF
jgi:hypothetical protein